MSVDNSDEMKIADSRIISAQPIFGRWAVFTGLFGKCTEEHVFAIGGLVAALVELTFEDGKKFTGVETMVPDAYGHYSLPSEEPEEEGEPKFIAILDSPDVPDEEELYDFVVQFRAQQKAKEEPSSEPPEKASSDSSKIFTLNPGRNGKDPKKPTKH